MKYFLLLISLITFNLINAQEINQLDEKGERHGKWQKKFPQSEILRYQGQFNHGKPYGTFNFFEAIKNKAVLVATRVFNTENDLADVTFYSAKGNVISKGKMNNKTYVGEWLYYHKDSKQIMTQEFYNNEGSLHGKKSVYYLSGQLAETMHYKKGFLYGESLSYSEKGKLLRVENYKNDLFHGVYKTFDGNGKPVEEGQYFNDERKGVWKFYENGKLVEERDLTRKSSNPYKNGKKK
ncbi:toxin-antitoxin system YwqK family antitoxin [Aurantibacter sp.]|uniref:toxin-antitoxin system YwqK family antitoxin n=1 Tax=Aurantibacter sp. TaxID=2807103 RepID=UPI0035C7B1B3